MTGLSYLDRPVFVCGHRRSGTTMLTMLLDNHPELVVYPTDSGFFYGVYPLLMAPGRTPAERIEQVVHFCIKNLQDIIDESFSAAERDAIAFPFDAFRAEFRRLAAATDASPRALLTSLAHAFHRQIGRPADPRCWVEKTTSSEIYAADAFGWFPQARFVHVVRDPRDNWASLKSGWETRFKHHNDSLSRLMQSMIERGKFGFELSRRNPELLGSSTYLVIRFEDLVADTSSVMRQVCAFLGLEFSPEVTQPTLLGRPWRGNNYDRKPFVGASRQNLGRWRERITAEEAHLLEYHFEDFMIRYGYGMESTLAQRVHAAVEHYKWYNYAQNYSFVTAQAVPVPAERLE